MKEKRAEIRGKVEVGEVGSGFGVVVDTKRGGKVEVWLPLRSEYVRFRHVPSESTLYISPEEAAILLSAMERKGSAEEWMDFFRLIDYFQDRPSPRTRLFRYIAQLEKRPLREVLRRLRIACSLSRRMVAEAASSAAWFRKMFETYYGLHVSREGGSRRLAIMVGWDVFVFDVGADGEIRFARIRVEGYYGYSSRGVILVRRLMEGGRWSSWAPLSELDRDTAARICGILEEALKDEYALADEEEREIAERVAEALRVSVALKP